MKKIFFDVGTFLFLRSLKCGDPVIGGALIGGGSLISGLFESGAQQDANVLNYEIAQQQMAQQEKLFHEGNDFNAEQAQIARDFNAQEAQANRIFQAGQLQRQMDWYQNYNSAQEQVKRYMQAGLNPAALGGKLDYSSSFGVPSGATATATPASAAAAPQVAGTHIEPVNPLKGVLKGAFDAYSAYNDAKLTQEKTKGLSIENEFKTQEKELGLKLTKSQIEENVAQVSYLSQEADLAKAKIAETQQMIDNLTKEGAKLDVEVELANLEKVYKSKAYEEMLGKLMEEHRLAKETADCYGKLVMSEILKNQSAAVASYSLAQYNNALSSLVPDERNRIIAEKSFIDSQTNGQRVQNYLNRKYGGKERAMKLKISQEEYDKLNWENSGFVRGVGIVKDVAITAASVAGTVYGVGAITGSAKAASAAAKSASSAARSANAASRVAHSARPYNTR